MSKPKTYLDNMKDTSHSGKEITIAIEDVSLYPDVCDVNFCWVDGLMFIDTRGNDMEFIHHLELFPVNKQQMIALRDYLNFCLLDFI